MSIFEDLIEEMKEENSAAIIVTESVERDTIAQTAPTPMPLLAQVLPPGLQNQTPPDNEMNFPYSRAADEITFLQILEQIFAGIEREQLKIVPKPYDDLKVKKLLHNVLQFSPEVNSTEGAKTELQLRHEIESWHWSLTQRDKLLTAGHLRRYCETSNPPLSSLAMAALARFYRNSPFSEEVRNKFDLVITRLFSKENSNNQRELVFNRQELVCHLTDLYAEWSGAMIDDSKADGPEILEIARKFESYAEYADDAIDFDDLIKSDFFKRLNLFKKNARENFYAPLITAISIETNIRIGNRYVELLEAEKQKDKVRTLENRYGGTYDNAISEAAAKTYSVVELLKQRKPVMVDGESKHDRQASKEKGKPARKENLIKIGASKPNKWLIAATILAILITVGTYFRTRSSPVEPGNTASKPSMNSGSSAFNEYLREARVESATLIGIVSPAWNQLTEETRKDALKQMLFFGKEKSYKKVQLENKEGKTVGYAAGESVVVLD